MFEEGWATRWLVSAVLLGGLVIMLHSLLGTLLSPAFLVIKGISSALVSWLTGISSALMSWLMGISSALVSWLMRNPSALMSWRSPLPYGLLLFVGIPALLILWRRVKARREAEALEAEVTRKTWEAVMLNSLGKAPAPPSYSFYSSQSSSRDRAMTSG
jgi:MFS family permease